MERSSPTCPYNWDLGSSYRIKGREHWESPRNILKTGMVLVLAQCCILEMLADYQIIKLLMKFKTYNNTGNTVKFELSQIAGGRVNVSALLENIWAKVLKGLRGRRKRPLGFLAVASNSLHS